MEGPLTVVGVSSERSLGDALNAGVYAASGEVVTKMDDDDWYGSDHLWDLMLALDYSGAELVAKGAEFVYMEELDITIRRHIGKAEKRQRTATMAGASLTVLRSAFEAVGLSRARGRRGSAFLGDMRKSGVRPFRTHGYGFVVHRDGDNTWQADTEYFLSSAVSQRAGLALDSAMVDGGPAPRRFPPSSGHRRART